MGTFGGIGLLVCVGVCLLLSKAFMAWLKRKHISFLVNVAAMALTALQL